VAVDRRPTGFMSALSFEITSRCRSTSARIGRIETPHGTFETPVFMPVGTRASVKGLSPAQVRGAGSTIILANAYHLLLRPGDELVGRRGGLHGFMRWDGPILTDSGGYQAFSMSDRNRLDESGVHFRSIVDGSKIHLTPERSIDVQNNLGADIIMAFDDCPPAADQDDAAYRVRLRDAHERTIRWLQRCIAAHRRPQEQALFGIVQGGTDPDLRAEAVERICGGFDLPGYAIGGVAVGEGTDRIRAVVEWTAPRMPEDRPRYLMGVGYEVDIVAAVRAGVDMFDCVLPTRNGRNAQAFTRTGRIHLRNARFAEDPQVIEPGCDCETCAGGYSRSYLRHLFQAGEMLGPTLVSIHNIRHFHRLLLDIRRAIREDGWSSLGQAWPVAAPALEKPASARTEPGPGTALA